MNDNINLMYLILAIIISSIINNYSKKVYKMLINNFPKKEKLIKRVSIVTQNILMIISFIIGINLIFGYTNTFLLPLYIGIMWIIGISGIGYIKYSFWVNYSILIYCIYTNIIK